jgi:serine/threonine protein phosphatase PrpC
MITDAAEATVGRRVRQGAHDTAVRQGVDRAVCSDRALALPSLAVVCDGVSRTDRSDLASELVCGLLASQLAGCDTFGAAEVERAFHAVLAELTERVTASVTTATTATAAVIVHGEDPAQLRLHLGWVGDSPAGILTDTSELRWLTWPDARHAGRGLGDDRIRSRGGLVQAMAPGADIEVHTISEVLPPGGSVLLASDGLLDGYHHVGDLLADPTATSARALVDAAAHAGSRDDLAAALLQPVVDREAGQQTSTARGGPRRSWLRPLRG